MKLLAHNSALAFRIKIADHIDQTLSEAPDSYQQYLSGQSFGSLTGMVDQNQVSTA